MSVFLIAFVVTGAAFVVLDMIWLSQMAPRVYRPQLGDIMGEGIRLGPAVAFYLIYIAGLTILVVAPAVSAQAPMQALALGGVLGFTAYATYDLTNWATLKRWSALVTCLDMAWGALATAAACWIGVTLTLMLAR